ncbi:hypothetical protein FRC17_009658 [Serendipita sp. 399]|nr:hypothetical protein FRC17_009658 [Serendipita sp. 399]
MPIAEVAKKSLGEIAYICRQTIRAGTKPEALERWLRWRLANAGRPIAFFEPTGAFNVITNWRDMKLMQIDFSGGLASPSAANGQKVNCVYGYQDSTRPWPLTGSCGIVHDDPRGGIWVTAILPREVWERPDGYKNC